jgi:hypothetical protein
MFPTNLKLTPSPDLTVFPEQFPYRPRKCPSSFIFYISNAVF